MTVFVDDMRQMYKPPHRPQIIYKMSHMFADSSEELMAFAELIGVDTRWVQSPPKHSWWHFDIAESKRVQAIRKGAIEISYRNELSRMVAARPWLKTLSGMPSARMEKRT